METTYDCLILGAGTAGLSAAIYACRAGLSVLILESGVQGGQILNSPEVENYPALPKISGFDFVQQLFSQATALGAVVVYQTAQQFVLDAPIKTVTTAQQTYHARTVLLATGAKHRAIGCAGEERLGGHGVSYCATCDGAFYRKKEVCVVGGGDSALEEAVYLSALCSTVYVIHRRDEFRAARALVEQVKSRPNIVVLFNRTVQEICGAQKVESVRLRDTQTGAEEVVLLSGVFVSVGMQPDTAAFASMLEVDEQGYFVADETCQTALAGVYVVGDVRRKQVRQLVTAAADGAVAATLAARYCRS